MLSGKLAIEEFRLIPNKEYDEARVQINYFP